MQYVTIKGGFACPKGFWKERILHFESHSHFVLEAAQVDFHHALNEGRFVDMVIRCLPELAEESVVDYAWKLRVLEKRNLVYELEVLIHLFGTMSSHGNISKDSFEVGLDDLIEEIWVESRVKVFNQYDFLISTQLWGIFTELRLAVPVQLVVWGVTSWWRFHGHVSATMCLAQSCVDWLVDWSQVTGFIRRSGVRYRDPGDVLA